MVLRVVTAASILLLAACASTAIQHNDDGTVSVECSGGYHDWSRCYKLAARVCRPGGVDIVSRVSDEDSPGVGSRDWSVGGSEVSRTLVVRCVP